MKKEDYIKLRESIRKEIISHVNSQELRAQNKEILIKVMIGELRKDIKDVRDLVLSHLYTARDRENSLIAEIDILKDKNV